MLSLCVDDDNRVILEPLLEYNDCQRDYINACYVDVSKTQHDRRFSTLHEIFLLLPLLQGFSTPKKFLATQGELQ